jgi:hypothetical protein
MNKKYIAFNYLDDCIDTRDKEAMSKLNQDLIFIQN